MKTCTIYCLMAGIALLTFGSCKKLRSDGSGGGGGSKDPGYTVNQNTAHVIADYDFNDTTLTNHGWTKAFEDNFNGDLSNWYVETGGVRGELECYEPANASAANGILQITAKHQDVTGPAVVDSSKTQNFNYTSAWLLSKQTFSASSSTPKVRVVARLKATSGYGLTTILVTYGEQWPINGEILCAEIPGYKTKEFGTTYSFGNLPGKNIVKGAYQFNPTDGDLAAGYHVYTMEWTQNSLNYYIDGNLVEMKTAGNDVPDLFGKSHRISINVPVGAHDYTGNLDPTKIQDGTISVDYVKVFTSN
ncbi:MAG TPA: glycoside hydrolase family 16 protein [Mucilaginibacter sp.]|nr:glycoside hydrolase family 16 protein [Mucilaginibacter sp.]